MPKILTNTLNVNIYCTIKTVIIHSPDFFN